MEQMRAGGAPQQGAPQQQYQKPVNYNPQQPGGSFGAPGMSPTGMPMQSYAQSQGAPSQVGAAASSGMPPGYNFQYPQEMIGQMRQAPPGMGGSGQVPQPTPQPQQQSQGGGPMQQMMPQGFPGQPGINTGPVYSQQQQEQLINQAIGQNSMAQGGQNMAVIDKLTGGGFAGGGSPKAQAMMNQNAVGRMQADNAARTGIPLQLAQINAQHQLAAQNAAENQYANRQGERLTGQGQQLGFLNGLMGSLLM